jgi:hypothetical protein
MRKEQEMVDTSLFTIIRRFFTLLVVCQVWSFGYAQIVILPDETSFSEEAISLTFEELRITALAGEVYAAYGVRFLGEKGSYPILQRVPLVPHDFGGDTVLRNESSNDSFSNGSLIIKFRYPLRRVGLTLDNLPGTEGLVASIQVFNSKSELLGAFTQEVPARPEYLSETFRPPFVGVETDHQDGIATLVLDYGESNIEQVNDILVDYLTPRIFRTYLPQIVQGGTSVFTKKLHIIGRRFAAHITVRFFDKVGKPLPLIFNGDEDDTFVFSLPLGNSYEMLADGSNQEVKVGYAVIESNHPIAAQATYSIPRQDVDQESEMGVPGREANIIHFSPVEREGGKGLDTGIVVINTGEAQASVSLHMNTPQGKPDEILTLPQFSLEAGAFRSFFLSELCQQPHPGTGVDICQPIDFLASGDFKGSLEVRSTEPIVVLTLRTVNGLPFSSLPVLSN